MNDRKAPFPVTATRQHYPSWPFSPCHTLALCRSETLRPRFGFLRVLQSIEDRVAVGRVHGVEELLPSKPIRPHADVTSQTTTSRASPTVKTERGRELAGSLSGAGVRNAALISSR